RGVAHARLPDQVPRRLRGGDQEEGCMRVLVLIMTAFLALGAANVAMPQLAEAQPVPAQQAPQAQRATTQIVKRTPHSDRVESGGKGMALLFWAFAAASVGGALFVITRRNLIAA